MTAEDLNRELDYWNRNTYAMNGTGFFSKAGAGLPVTCLPLRHSLWQYPLWRSPETFKDTPANDDAPEGLLPALKEWGELPQTALFSSVRDIGLDAGLLTPGLTAPDYLAELTRRNARLAAKQIGLYSGHALEGEIRYTYQTGTRYVDLPDTADLTDAQARHDARAAAIMAGIPGEWTVTQDGDYQRGVGLGVYTTDAGSMTAEADIETQYETTGDTARLRLRILATTEKATVKNRLKVPITLTVIWQDLPYSLATSDPAPEVVPYWTAPLTLPCSCRTLWDPAAAGFIGTAAYSQTWDEWPQLRWQTPPGTIPFAEAIQDLKVQWKTLDLEPGEKRALFPHQFTLPDYLTIDHLTAFHDLRHRRTFWLAYRPKETE